LKKHTNVCMLLYMNRMVDDLEQRLNGVCGSLNLLHAQLVDLVVQALADNLWAQYGIRSPEHWLTWKSGLSAYRARDIVMLARRKAELPYIFSVFDQGLLAVDQVVMLARHCRVEHDRELSEIAPAMTVTQLSSVLSRYCHHDDVGVVEPKLPRASRGDDDDDDDDDDDITVESRFSDGDPDEVVDWAWLYGTGDSPASDLDPANAPADDTPRDDQAAVTPAATDPSEADAADLEPAEATPGQPTTAEPESEPAWTKPLAGHVVAAAETLSYGWTADGRFRLSFTGNADTGALLMQALDEIRDALFQQNKKAATGGQIMREFCQRAIANVSPDRADRFRAYLHLDTDGAWLNGGPRVPQWLRRKLTCDGHLTPVWETAGTPVNLGRTVRTFPDHIRRLILDRDRTCRRPGCSNTKGLEVHHVQHWEDGGESNPDNGAGLCSGDHDAHHRGEFTIRGNANLPDGLEFRDRDGRLIPNGPQPAPPAEPPPTVRYVHPLGESFDPNWFFLSEPPAHLRRSRHPLFEPEPIPA
jgi:HNH endonuclease